MSTSRTLARDLVGAIAVAEGAVAERVFWALEGTPMAETNAFGRPIAVERGVDVAALARQCAEAASLGERVALVARAADLAAARSELAAIAERRLGVVVHALAEPAGGGLAPANAGIAPVLSLDHLPWGVLVGAGVAEALDLALIARRAAEDSASPFLVVHELTRAHPLEPLAAPAQELCDAFLGKARGGDGWPRGPSKSKLDGGASAPGSTFADRAPFALASAMREFESLAGRRHDAIERAPGGDSALALVGIGASGEALLADVERLRAAGVDVGAVRIVAWRPFPGARLVKTLCRSLSVTVVEDVGGVLLPGGPLSLRVKASFADALTWAPDYPGVGSIPRIVSGVIAPHHEVESADIDALVDNMLADERGQRLLVFGCEDDSVRLGRRDSRASAVGEG